LDGLVLRIGLTGGIAAGKSTVAAVWRELGAIVVDADTIAREVVAAGSPGLAAVVREFGQELLRADGTLDRAALGRLVFSDDEARARLNAITHPLIAARTRELMDAVGQDRIIVHDVPLLVENHLGPDYHLVAVVHAEVEERVSRLVRLRGMAEAEARERVRSQADDAQRRRAADVWLDSGRGLEHLRDEAARLWTGRLQPFDAQLRARTRAPRGPARVVPYKPEWPDDAQRLAERIRHHAHDEGLPVEHIGSTAVPGLAAKDVVDLQVGVPALAAADRLRPALERAGFALVPGLTRDNPHPGVNPDPAAWKKAVHASCDPGRPVNVHVRELGGPGWRTALLMRDWLRAVPAAREEYAELKAALAVGELGPGEYAEAKEPWVAAAVPRALAWRAQE
jgi:dephospho-CoA kinase